VMRPICYDWLCGYLCTRLTSCGRWSKMLVLTTEDTMQYLSCHNPIRYTPGITHQVHCLGRKQTVASLVGVVFSGPRLMTAGLFALGASA
jgi:hypothetical protein